jgi:hypothetical protein
VDWATGGSEDLLESFTFSPTDPVSGGGFSNDDVSVTLALNGLPGSFWTDDDPNTVATMSEIEADIMVAKDVASTITPYVYSWNLADATTAYTIETDNVAVTRELEMDTILEDAESCTWDSEAETYVTWTTNTPDINAQATLTGVSTPVSFTNGVITMATSDTGLVALSPYTYTFYFEMLTGTGSSITAATYSYTMILTINEYVDPVIVLPVTEAE